MFEENGNTKHGDISFYRLSGGGGGGGHLGHVCHGASENSNTSGVRCKL